MVSGSYDGIVRIWDTATGETLRELKGHHAHGVRSVVVSPDCQHIISGSRDAIWIWTKDGVIEHKLGYLTKNFYTDLNDLAFLHDGH